MDWKGREGEEARARARVWLAEATSLDLHATRMYLLGPGSTDLNLYRRRSVNPDGPVYPDVCYF